MRLRLRLQLSLQFDKESNHNIAYKNFLCLPESQKSKIDNGESQPPRPRGAIACNPTADHKRKRNAKATTQDFNKQNSNSEI
jgi:hypothetical protein